MWSVLLGLIVLPQGYVSHPLLFRHHHEIRRYGSDRAQIVSTVSEITSGEYARPADLCHRSRLWLYRPMLPILGADHCEAFHYCRRICATATESGPVSVGGTSFFTSQVHIIPRDLRAGVLRLAQGVGIMALASPMMALFCSDLNECRQQQLKMVDRRVRLTSEALSTIRQIKLYAYEGYFGKRITDYREKELARLRKRKKSEASLSMLMVRTIPPEN